MPQVQLAASAPMVDVSTDDAHLAPYRRNCLNWFAEAGFGYFEVEGAPYDAAYFDRYLELEDTLIGRALMDFRTRLVSTWAGDTATLLDVGIGSGAFLKARWDATPYGAMGDHGYDVNPAGLKWLREAGRFGDLYAQPWRVATFWDVLEHIRRPDLALAQVSGWAFVSIPVFSGPEHVLASKHYRRDEHYWYWTPRGFIAFAQAQGFLVRDMLSTEVTIGREDVMTFVLERVPGPCG